MNRAQRTTLITAALLVLASGVWVPWKAKAEGFATGTKIHAEAERSCGYYWAFGQPPVDWRALFPDVVEFSSEAHIDTTRLLIQWIGLTVAAILLTVAFKE